MLIGQPMDSIAQRESAEESRQKRIQELDNDLLSQEARANLLQE